MLSFRDNFPIYRQLNIMDCGPSCIKIIAKYYGKYFDIHFLKDLCGLDKEGVSIHNLCIAIEKIGLKTFSTKLSFDILRNQISLPIIIFWKKSHYIVVYKISKKRIFVSDPAKGKVSYTIKEFLAGWLEGQDSGVAILIEPTQKFMDIESKKINPISAFSLLFNYLKPYKSNIVQLIVVMVIITTIMAVLPFLTKAIFDIGIQTEDISFITLLLIANLLLVFFKSIGQWIKSTISLHLGSRIKISLISDYLIKLLKLPISFFEDKLIGDIIQRSRDQERIQNFITNSAIGVILSLLLLIVYSIILFLQNPTFFYIFSISTLIYIVWVMLFYSIRKKMDFKYFELIGENQSQWIELMTSISDIKSNNYENTKRWKWEKVQVGLYKVGIKLLDVDRKQQLGADFINSVKDILLTFFAAKLVIDGEITIGTMISIQFIIGQLTIPVQEIIMFIKTMQMAYISYLRIGEINSIPNEQDDSIRFSHFPINKSIRFDNVSFSYKKGSNYILNNISFEIEENKTTAIVGSSGSGKSTLLKLLIGNYTNYLGNIFVGDSNIKNIDIHKWRSGIGSVMQESKIFNDTILNNIVLNDETNFDNKRLDEVLRLVNIKNEIERLPKGIYTKMGEVGRGLSTGQKQRILIARALYKKSDYIFLDEATNSLDSFNESIIAKNLEMNTEKTTFLIVGHRLSTVRQADKIVVIDQGEVKEVGIHTDLIRKRGHYFRLFADQLRQKDLEILKKSLDGKKL